jgi:hypothetical protein
MMLAAACCAAPLAAQKWEVGAGGGMAFYNSHQISGADGTVDAKFKPAAGFTAYIGQIGNRVGGEVRYSMLFNGMELKGSGQPSTMSGSSQSFGYNVLIYTNGKESKTRGYFLVGGGMKYYTGSGGETVWPPYMRTAVLTETSEWKPMIMGGAGVRFNVGEKAHVRAEMLVQATEAPKEVITPITGDLGWYFSFAPMFSISYVW